MLFTERIAVAEAAAEAALTAVLSHPDGVRASYQPIVRLGSGEVVGYEALARWPATPDITPTEMFSAARRLGLAAQLDDACRTAAITGIADTGFGRSQTLFVNVEVDSITPNGLVALSTLARGRCRLVLELTERSLLDNPGRVLEIAEQARDLGFGVALDDVGSNADSMTMLDFVAPDIIKLDRSLLRTTDSPANAATVAAVIAHAEATGALILVEGIETTEERARAITFGAILGQGWLFGHPAAPPTTRWRGAGLSGIPLGRGDRGTPGMPSDLMMMLPTETASSATIVELMRNLEDHALQLPEPLTILTTVSTPEPSIGSILARYRRLARDNAFVALLSPDLPSDPAPGVRGGTVPMNDPFAGEWAVVILGHSYCAALIARDPGDPVPSEQRRFRYLLTFDRTVTTMAAQAIMRRIGPIDQPVDAARPMPPIAAGPAYDVPLAAEGRPERRTGPGALRMPRADPILLAATEPVTVSAGRAGRAEAEAERGSSEQAASERGACERDERSARSLMLLLAGLEILPLAAMLLIGAAGQPPARPLGVLLTVLAAVLVATSGRGAATERTLWAATIVGLPAVVAGAALLDPAAAIPLIIVLAATFTIAAAVGSARRRVLGTALAALVGIGVVTVATAGTITVAGLTWYAGALAIALPLVAVDRLRRSRAHTDGSETT
ncbi:sensor domain-containing phosphodiesterase [Millisia brevis]|uniref:sensor domain-containing phosphodiesterase n=1 Tax=Millisia brevis TaxID=264148 RepID=UPI0008375CBE|nr:EAL domain-containing protein [Millisia brevis]